MVGSYWLPIGNHTFGIQWSHDRWRHVTRKVNVVTLLWCHEMFAIQYRLTFCLYIHSLYEVPLHSPSTISVWQPDVMSTSWNELLRRFRCVISPLTWYINFSFVHLQYITSYVRSQWWSLVIVRDNYSCLVIIRLHHYQWWRLLFLSLLLLFFFFLRTRSLSAKHETCTGMDPKWT